MEGKGKRLGKLLFQEEAGPKIPAEDVNKSRTSFFGIKGKRRAGVETPQPASFKCYLES